MSVEPVHLDALLQRRDVGPRLGHRGAIGGRHDVDDDDRREQADDDDDDHHLDQGEAGFLPGGEGPPAKRGEGLERGSRPLHQAALVPSVPGRIGKAEHQ